MAFCCADIDTLVHTYLDGELAEHDLHELEQHLRTCGGCKARVDEELQFRAELRRKLTPPKAPDLLRARVSALLDAEDHAAQVAQRRRSASWILPGAASVAAAAALILVVVNPAANDEVAQPATGGRASPSPESGRRDPGVTVRHVPVPDFSPYGAKPRSAAFNQAQGAEFTYEYERDHARHLFDLVLVPDARLLPQPEHRAEADGVEAFVGSINGMNWVVIPRSDGSATVFRSGSMSSDLLFDLARRSIKSQNDGWLRNPPDPEP